jgi:hypothetical protein
MREFLENLWIGGTCRRLPVVLAASSGQIGARLPGVGTRGDLVIAPDASLVFCEPEVSEAVLTSSGMRTITTASGSSTVIAAQDVAALNIHTGRGACVFEVTLASADESAAFARSRSSEYASPYGDVRYFARQLRKERARQGLREIEVTRTIDWCG